MSPYIWAVLLDTKATATNGTKRRQAVTEECVHKLQVLCTDNGDEFTATEFMAYCANEGIQHHFTPYTSEQNGIVERRNQMVVATA